MQIHEWDGWQRGFEQVRGPTDLHPLADESVDWRAYHQKSRLNGFAKYLAAAGHAFASDNRTIPSLRYGLKFTRQEDDGARHIRQRAIATEFDSEEFLFVNLMEAHTPHYPPDDYRTIHEGIKFSIGDAFAGDVTDGDRNRKAYDDSAAYLSHVYRDIFNVLTEEFDYVITFSDHGEMLGEHGMWNHGYGIYPELAHVPMVISGDGIKGRSVDRTVSLLDVPQTIAEITSVEFTGRGVDLLADSTGRDYLVEYHGLLPWHRDQLRRKGVESLFDELDRPLRGIALESGDYVYQTDDEYISTEGTISDEKIGELNSLTEEIPERSVESDSEDVGSEVEERLKNLGYA
jgi:arylsulfatase